MYIHLLPLIFNGDSASLTSKSAEHALPSVYFGHVGIHVAWRVLLNNRDVNELRMLSMGARMLSDIS